MSLELPTIIIPGLLFNMLLCGLAAAAAWHAGALVEKAVKAIRIRQDE